MCVTKGGRQGEGGVTAGHSGGERECVLQREEGRGREGSQSVCVLQREEGRGREGSQRVTAGERECVCATKGDNSIDVRLVVCVGERAVHGDVQTCRLPIWRNANKFS